MGSKDAAPVVPLGTPITPAVQQSVAEEKKIRVFDGFGRELFISLTQWWQNVLPGTIEKAWNDPDRLYSIIVTAMRDGIRSEIVPAAEHLFQIDPNVSRGTCLWGVVLLEEGRLDDAEKVLQKFLTMRGDDGYILTNLAKVYSKRGRTSEADDLLWHALKVDPNQENALTWFQAIHRDREGESGLQAALLQVAALPASWRAQLWLARGALASDKVGAALSYYQQSLTRAGRPVPADLLFQMSGDLGKKGRLVDLLALTEPEFQFELHGLQVGNNLIKAHLDLGHLEQAKSLVDRLFAMNRPDWKQTLSFWETEIAKARIAGKQVDPAQLQISLPTIAGPIWLSPDAKISTLFAPAKSKDAPVVCFIGSSATIASAPDKVQLELSNAAGRMSRAVPLFLSEQVYFGTATSTQTIVPWVAQGGFMLSGVPWDDAQVVSFARAENMHGDYVVTTHLLAEHDPWQVELRLLGVADGQLVASLRTTFSVHRTEEGLPQLAIDLLEKLSTELRASPITAPPAYMVPGGIDFSHYLLRLEQLLAARCGFLAGANPNFLSGEREILDGNLQLCVRNPANVTTRLLLARTMATLAKLRPEVVREFDDRVALLQKTNPLNPLGTDTVEAALHGDG